MSRIPPRPIWLPLIACLTVGCAGTIVTKAQSRLNPKHHVKPVQRSAKIFPAGARTRFTLTKIRAREGDSLATIAAAHRLSVDELARLNGRPPDAELKPGQEIRLPASAPKPGQEFRLPDEASAAKPLQETRLPASASASKEAEVIGKRIRFADGSAIDSDDVWRQGEEFWYRKGGVTARVDRPVHLIEPIRAEPAKESRESAASPRVTEESGVAAAQSIWILLQGGARVKVDAVNEVDAGVWYRRGSLSIFLERDRIARIERESAGAKPRGWREWGWTSGNPRIDDLIRANGVRFGVDPYLVFCVIEKESKFHTRAVSPKGARGLMQLMPATASHFGVRRPFDPAENIFGGTQYLKLLLEMFGGRLDLALAGYNAGAGAVLKSGGSVPRYAETRDYVRKITQRYGADTPEPVSPSPQ